MSKPIPTISHFMSTNPHSIGTDQSLKVAADLMERHHIRHLPVLERGNLVGIVSDRDIKFACSFRGVDPATAKVSEISREEVYIASPQDPIDQVVSTMAGKRYGSAVVMDNKKLVGIFTVVDALKALDELLHTRLA
jgi:acetoin utilization protein AcuB